MWAGEVGDAGADLRDGGFAIADRDAGDADGDAVFPEGPSVPLGEVAVGNAERAEQATGDRKRLAREQGGDGLRDLFAEVGGTGVRGLCEDQEAEDFHFTLPLAVDEPGPVLLHLPSDDRVAADPGGHSVTGSRPSGTRRGRRHATVWGAARRPSAGGEHSVPRHIPCNPARSRSR